MIPLDYELHCNECGRMRFDEKPEAPTGTVAGMMVCLFMGFLMGAALILTILKIRSLM